MRKSLLITMVFYCIAYGMSNNELEKFSEEYKDNSSSKIDTLHFNNKSISFNTFFVKSNKTASYINSEGYNIKSHNTITGFINLNGIQHKLFENNHVYVQGQNITQIVCESKDYIILTLMLRHVNEGVKFGGIEYEPYLYEISKSNIKDITFKSDSTFKYGFTSFNLSRQKRYPYYTKEKILDRLYATNVCSRTLPKILEIEKTLKQKKDLKTYNNDFFIQLLVEKSIEKENLTSYNNIAYYLQKAGANKKAIYLLEKILQKFPNRTVAYYNLGDAYWAVGEKEKAVKVYKTYVEQMKKKDLGGKIPQKVKDRIGVRK